MNQRTQPTFALAAEPVEALESPAAAVAPAARARVLLVVANRFCDHDTGWYDIRVHRFAQTFQDMGFQPVVYCRWREDGEEETAECLGIPFKRLTYRKPMLDAARTRIFSSSGGGGRSGRTPPDVGQGWSRAPVRRIVRGGSNLALALLQRYLIGGLLRARRVLVTPFTNQFNFHFAKLLMKAAADDRPAFIYAADLHTLWATTRLARHHGCPLVYDSHEYFESRAEHEGMSWLRRTADTLSCRYLERRYLPRAHTVLSVSPSIINALARRCPKGSYLCVRNIPRRDTHPPRQDRIRARTSIPAGVKIALYIGFVTGGRGIDRLVEAARHLPEDIAIAVLGGGRLLEECKAQARRTGVESRVFFLGQVPQSEVLDYAASADCGLCLIQPTCLSYVYSLPNKIFQYISSGTPVLCSNFPDMSTLVKEHDIGATVDPTDPIAIGRALTDLLSSPERLAQMRRNCRHAIDNGLHWDEEVRQLDFVSEFREPRP